MEGCKPIIYKIFYSIIVKILITQKLAKDLNN